MNTTYPELIESVKLDLWLANQKNVLFIGEHGVGKTSAVISAFERNNLKYLYLSTSTCDPYLDFVGIPRVVIENGVQKLKLVTREDLMDAEIIFLDEYNRAPKKVRNACMELIQFRSINGKAYPNLKMVWAAINPSDDQDTYDVEELDPAQMDRFHIHCLVPYEPCKNYFASKYGERHMVSAVSWWNELPVNIKKLVSPRRMDYALTYYLNEGGDLRDVLPETANITKLLDLLGGPDISTAIEEALASFDLNKAKKIINDDNRRNEVLTYLFEKKTEDETNFFVSVANQEVLNNIISQAIVSKNEIGIRLTELIVDRATEHTGYQTMLVSGLKANSFDAPTQCKIRGQFLDKHGRTMKTITDFPNFFHKVNTKAEIYVRGTNNAKITFKEHVDAIRVSSDNYNFDTPYSKTKAWNSLKKFVPEVMTLEGVNAAFELMDKLALQKRRTGSFFNRYDSSLRIFNKLMEQWCLITGDFTTTLLEKTYRELFNDYKQYGKPESFFLTNR